MTAQQSHTLYFCVMDQDKLSIKYILVAKVLSVYFVITEHNYNKSLDCKSGFHAGGKLY